VTRELQMNRNRIAIVSTTFPYPADTGKKVVLSGILSYLVGRFGHENVIYILLGRASQLPVDRTKFAGQVIQIQKPGFLTQAANVFRHSLLGRSKSIQEALLFSQKLCKELNSVLSTYSPRMIIFDTVRTGQFLEHVHADVLKDSLHVLYMDDLFSMRYQRMINTLSSYPEFKMDPVGTYRSFLPPLLSAAAQFRPMQKVLLAWEKRLIQKSEDRQPELFDISLLLNGQEVFELQRRIGSATIRQIKPLLACADNSTVQRNYRGNCEFIFLGSLNYAPNQVSIEYFVSRNMDRLIDLMPSVKLHIIGKGASPRLVRLVQRYVGYLSIEGYVDDLASIFTESCAMLVPLLFGSGIKLKTLEAFSFGLPVICTDYGVEGIRVTGGTHCIIENDIGKYPELMAGLCNVEVNNAISRSCRELFIRDYSRASVSQEYDRIFDIS
jgi:glycosyltransferase involved in cell wall biosynthesis